MTHTPTFSICWYIFYCTAQSSHSRLLPHHNSTLVCTLTPLKPVTFWNAISRLLHWRAVAHISDFCLTNSTHAPKHIQIITATYSLPSVQNISFSGRCFIRFNACHKCAHLNMRKPLAFCFCVLLHLKRNAMASKLSRVQQNANSLDNYRTKWQIKAQRYLLLPL